MKDRIALVTGAGRGIGRASALTLAAGGARVVVTSRSKDELDSLVDAIQTAGGDAWAIVGDLSDPTEPQRIVEAAASHWGPIEILVNNAGIGSSSSPKPLVDFDDDFWDLTFAINVKAPYLMTKWTLPAMLERGWGRIINIASINAFVPALHGAAYVASKHAVAGLTKATAKEVEGTRITCNAVCPGVTRSLMNDKRLEYDAERLGTTIAELEAKASPLGRRLVPEEIASTVAYLARNEAGGINGQAIRVCGGTVMA